MQNLVAWAKNASASSPSTVSPLSSAEIEGGSRWVLDPTTVGLAARAARFSGGFSPSTLVYLSPATAVGAFRQSTKEDQEESFSECDLQLLSVGRHYEAPNPGALRGFFPNTALTFALVDAAKLIPQTFELSGKPILRAIADGDDGDIVELQIVVPVRLSVEEASALLESFDTNWWMNLPDSVRRILTIDVAFT